MTNPAQRSTVPFPHSLRTSMIALALLCGLTAVTMPAAQAQTFQVLHSFTNGIDGGGPYATVTVDQWGSLYGTTTSGGASNRGTVFKLAQTGSGWVFSPLYTFTTSEEFNEAPLAIGPDGALYGTTTVGGAAEQGTAYRLHPPASPCRHAPCYWSENILYNFTGQPDGSIPGYGAVVFDRSGNVYGTTVHGGASNGGTVYKLTRSPSGWTESIAYGLSGGTTGINPWGGVIFDQAGNLYGAASAEGYGSGAVYELSPSGSGWTPNILFAFPLTQPGDGAYPYGGLVFDASGNLYGTTYQGGSNYDGVVYQLSPSRGSWQESVLYNFTGPSVTEYGYAMARDSAGNLYGASSYGGPSQHGNVFKLSFSGGQWIYTDLHDFDDPVNGEIPVGGVAVDANGNVYGTTSGGGTPSNNCPYGCGTVWEITPSPENSWR